jgi:hypothetical protein
MLWAAARNCEVTLVPILFRNRNSRNHPALIPRACAREGSRLKVEASVVFLCVIFGWRQKSDQNNSQVANTKLGRSQSRSAREDPQGSTTMTKGTGQELQSVLPTNNRIVRKWYYYRDNNELVELSVLRQKRK